MKCSKCNLDEGAIRLVAQSWRPERRAPALRGSSPYVRAELELCAPPPRTNCLPGLAFIVSSLLCLTLSGCAQNALTENRGQIEARVQQQSSNLLDLYKHLHTHPELSFMEEKTSARMAEELRKAGYEVTTGVGKYGVVAVLANGTGPAVLVRTDMDALP